MKILITGASSGIGACFARVYATKENSLILLARRKEKLLKLQKELSLHAKDIKIIQADVREFDDLKKKIDTIGDVDMAILNAGISLGHNNTKIPSVDEFKNLYDVNLFANHAILEVLLPKFVRQNSGKIVFISSLASLASMPSAKVYASSKRALNAYAEAIRYKYHKHNIKIITILPGFIKSELTDKNNFKMPFFMQTKEAVLKMKKAIDKDKNFYAFPFGFYLLIRLFNLLPHFLKVMILKRVFY